MAYKWPDLKMDYEVIVIGGGQSALACAYFLRRIGLSFVLLDDQKQSGGAWLHTWDSLTLFSPAEYSSLPGWLMPASQGKFPSKEEVINYLAKYEHKYHLPVERPVKVHAVRRTKGGFSLDTSKGTIQSKAVISATGTWQQPFAPKLPGREFFRGEQLHSAHYTNPFLLKGKKVLIVGGGNSGAQLLAEISKVTETAWCTLQPPTFLPDDVDGRVLFDVATAKYHAQKEGKPFNARQYNLGDIVMVPPVAEARERGVLNSKGRLNKVTENGAVWENRQEENFDAIIWCTGFHYATAHLQPLGIVDEQFRVATEGTRAKDLVGLWLVGYGNWTGFASATLIGVGRSARQTVGEIAEYLKNAEGL